MSADVQAADLESWYRLSFEDRQKWMHAAAVDEVGRDGITGEMAERAADAALMLMDSRTQTFLDRTEEHARQAARVAASAITAFDLREPHQVLMLKGMASSVRAYDSARDRSAS